jgi:hypothetical protein
MGQQNKVMMYYHLEAAGSEQAQVQIGLYPCHAEYVIDFSQRAVLRSLKNIQIRQFLQFLHALIIRLDDLLVVEQNPVTPDLDVSNVVTRVDRRTFMRYECFEVVFSREG